jgi:hypothetical protein
MRKGRKSASAVAHETGGRLLLHLGPGLRQVIDSDEVYYVEAKADDTEVRTRSAKRLSDVRPIGALTASFVRQGFVRIHRNYLVNPRHVRLVRRRPQGGRLGGRARGAGERRAASEPQRLGRVVDGSRGGLGAEAGAQGQ